MRMCGVGDNVVDRYVTAGVMYPGGSAANVAVHCRRMGLMSSYIGIVGDDEPGNVVSRALAAEGVDLSRVRFRPEPNSYADVVLEGGDRRFTHYVPPASALVLDDADLAILAGCNWVHTGHSSQIDTEVPKMARVTKVVYDFSFKGFEHAEQLLPHVDVAVFSRADHSEEQCLQLISAARRMGPTAVVVTRGVEGAFIRWGSQLIRQAAAPANAVDTLGAGDAFVAALLCSVAKGSAVGDAAAIAAEYAARTCEHHGAFGYPVPFRHTAKEAPWKAQPQS